MIQSVILLLGVLLLNAALPHYVYAADTSIVAVNATVLTNNNCRFSGVTSSAALNFGNLDPANPVDRTVNSSVNFRCNGGSPMATFFISDDDGLYETGLNANRMRHTTTITEFIPYTFTLNPITGTIPRNTLQTLTLTGTVNGTDYQNAVPGTYLDSVVITIVP
jgi:spore coat protein U-like protein